MPPIRILMLPFPPRAVAVPRRQPESRFPCEMKMVKVLSSRKMVLIGWRVVASPRAADRTVSPRRTRQCTGGAGFRNVIWAARLATVERNRDGVEIVYPPDGAVFPHEIASDVSVADKHPEADTWLVAIEFGDGREPLKALTHSMEWTPAPQQWRDAATRSLESRAKVTVLGVKRTAANKILSCGTIGIRTSRDEVGAPLFFREVNLPFLTAVTDPARYIRWRLGPVSSREPPPIVLEKLRFAATAIRFPVTARRSPWKSIRAMRRAAMRSPRSRRRSISTRQRSLIGTTTNGIQRNQPSVCCARFHPTGDMWWARSRTAAGGVQAGHHVSQLFFLIKASSRFTTVKPKRSIRCRGG